MRGKANTDEVEPDSGGLTAAARAVLEEIAANDKEGLIEPAVVVEAARDPSSPLHNYFTWDDTEAAARFRVHQARKLIIRVRVTRTDNTPRYVAVTLHRSDKTRRHGYVNIQAAMANEELYTQVARAAISAIRSWRMRLNGFQELRAAALPLDDAVAAIERALPGAPKGRRGKRTNG